MAWKQQEIAAKTELQPHTIRYSIPPSAALSSTSSSSIAYTNSLPGTCTSTTASSNVSTLSSESPANRETVNSSSATATTTPNAVVTNAATSIKNTENGITPPSASRKRVLEMDDFAAFGSDEDDGAFTRYRFRRRKTAMRTSRDGTPLDESPSLKPSPFLAEFLRPFETPPIEKFARGAGVATPQYIHVLENDYSLAKRGVDADEEEEGEKDFVSSGDWVCDCAMPEAPDQELACGEGCVNRAINVECGSRCPAHAFCSNRRFQRRLYAPTEPFYCGPEKGWGLRATKDIPEGAFIVEYCGEVIDFAEFKRRVRHYERVKHVHHYFMALGPKFYIDAGTKGNWARFVNHSCAPNAETQKWTVKGKIRIGFFAVQDIRAGEEITIDYQFVQYGKEEQKCYCGAPNCSGIMGSKSKSLQDKIRLRDVRELEKRIDVLLKKEFLLSKSDVVYLIKILVQEFPTRYSRLELLKMLVRTETESYLKLFRQYNGLEVLASFMCDTQAADWEMKLQILRCLEHIPVSEQKQVQTNSGLMDFVKQWTLDPRYCRTRDSISAMTAAALESAVQAKAEEKKASALSGEQERLIEANRIRVYPPEEEQEMIESIRQLASLIHERWSKLPLQNYRIPRLEREATEKSILQSSKSSLVSLSASDTKEEDQFKSWRSHSQNSSSNGSRHRRSRRNRDQSQEPSISLSEHRARLEAEAAAAEAAAAKAKAEKEKSATEATPASLEAEHTSHTNPQLSDLVVRALKARVRVLSGGGEMDEKAAVAKATAELSAIIDEFNAEDDTTALIAVLCKLAENPQSLSSPQTSILPSTRTNETPSLDPSLKLPKFWLPAFDPVSERTYFYHTVTREVRWVPPQPPPKRSEFEERVHRVVMRLLRPFRFSNCVLGRLESEEDVNYVADRFTSHLARSVASRHSTKTITPEMVDQWGRQISRYLTSKGPVYRRSSAPRTTARSSNGAPASVAKGSSSDMEVDEEEA